MANDKCGYKSGGSQASSAAKQYLNDAQAQASTKMKTTNRQFDMAVSAKPTTGGYKV